jgi:DNA repair photolyase
MLFAPSIEEGLALARRVDAKYAPAWHGKSPRDQAALAWYFLPHKSAKPLLSPTRPRVIKWYCPFADQKHFPSGHRYCINVYTGCSHRCVYCYAAGYVEMQPAAKDGFRKSLLADLDDLDAFDVPAAPMHLSNSTDAFQPLEARAEDTLFTLRQLARRRRHFTTITLLTKNPSLLAGPHYLDALLALHQPLQRVAVEVSLAFWREEIAAAYDPGCPTVAERLAAMADLRRAGIPLVLRISPTYPIDLAPDGNPCPQTRGDLENLIAAAAAMGVEMVVHTPAKIVRPKTGPLHPLMESMLTLYRRLAGREGLGFHGGAWRLGPEAARQFVISPVEEICRRSKMPLAFCMHHLLQTR